MSDSKALSSTRSETGRPLPSVAELFRAAGLVAPERTIHAPNSTRRRVVALVSLLALVAVTLTAVSLG